MNGKLLCILAGIVMAIGVADDAALVGGFWKASPEVAAKQKADWDCENAQMVCQGGRSFRNRMGFIHSCIAERAKLSGAIAVASSATEKAQSEAKRTELAKDGDRVLERLEDYVRHAEGSIVTAKVSLAAAPFADDERSFSRDKERIVQAEEGLASLKSKVKSLQTSWNEQR